MKLGIKSKLIIIMVTANCIVAGMMYWLSSKSFDEDFLGYITQVELEKLKPLTDELALLYQQKNGWEWIRDEHYLWRQVLDYHVRKRPLEQLNRRPPPPPQFGKLFQPRRSGQNFEPRPPPRPNGRPPVHYAPQVKRIDERVPSFDEHLLLRDEFEELLIGRIKPFQTIDWLPIIVEERIVGDVGVIFRKNESSNFEQYFIDQQKGVFANIVVVMFFIAIAVAFLLSRKLMGHVNLLQTSLSALVKGDYEQEIKVTSNDELGQLATDFNFLSQTLKENQQSRQQWIADISHELRTPVAILKGELEALIDGVRKVDEAALFSLQQEADRLTMLINDLHELSLSDLGALNYQKENVDLNDLVSEFLDEQMTRSEAKGLQLSYVSDDEACFAQVDANRIEQCLTNFLQNTLRYTDLPGQLKVSVMQLNQSVVLTWEDSSPGVEKENLDHLFERLYRVEKSRNRAQGGAGLGLSICKNIVDAHNAKITLFNSSLGGLGLKIIFSKV